MSILHTVNASPFGNSTLSECLAICCTQDSILLLEEGVYAAISQGPWARALAEKITQGVNIYMLENDAQARGIIEQKCLAGIHLCDYNDFVSLSCKHQSIQSWY